MAFLDSFVGAAGQKLHARSGWTKYAPGGDAFSPEVNASNQLRSATDTSDTALVGQQTSSTSHYAQARVYPGFSWTGTGARSFICVRAADRNSFWGVSHNAQSGLWELYSPLGRDGSTAGTLSAGDLVRIEADTAQVRVYVNGTLKLSSTTTYLNTQTIVGLLGRGTGGSDPIIDDWESDVIGAADVTAPTLSAASASATGATAATGSVTTNESNGTLYYLASTSGTATAAAVKAASSQAVSATGAQAVSVTGLTQATTYYLHFLHRDAAGNDSAVATTASFATPAVDSTVPTLSGVITVGAKTSSTITVSWPSATDNVGVTGYEVSSDAGSTWSSIGASLTTQFTGLAALTSYAIRVRAFDAAGNRSAALSVATSTYRAGALGSTILLTTGPVPGGYAGIMYPFVLAGDEGKWFSFRVITPPATGTLTLNPDGTFTFFGPQAETMSVQMEVDGADFGSPFSVTLYDQSGGGGGDVTAPTLSAASASATGATTASGSVSTSEAGGTLYYLVSTSSTATAAAVKAAASQSVSSSGAQSVLVSGLVASTAYYLHFLHRDAAGNDSAVATTSQFTTQASPPQATPSGAGAWYFGLKRKYG